MEGAGKHVSGCLEADFPVWVVVLVAACIVCTALKLTMLHSLDVTIAETDVCKTTLVWVLLWCRGEATIVGSFTLMALPSPAITTTTWASIDSCLPPSTVANTAVLLAFPTPIGFSGEHHRVCRTCDSA